MKNRILVVLTFVLFTTIAQAQDKYYTKSGKIEFYSKTPLEDIQAENKSVAAVLDAKTGMLQFSVLMKGFEFENEEMQDHFNRDYVETDKYPKAEFKGQLTNNSAINYNKPGTYPVQVKGLLTIHGVTREVSTIGSIKVEANQLKANASFNIEVADFNIRIPSLVKDKVAKTVKINVDTKLDPLKG